MSRSTMYSTLCADCGASDPSWASVNRGVLICDECCSVHRSLGRHISQVTSLKKGQWRATQYAMVIQLSKQGANNIWEHALLDPSQNKHGRRKPSPRDPLHPNKSDFIRAKYQFLSFVNKHKDSDINSIDDVSKELHSSVRTNNVETCLRLLSKGADPNYFHMEKGNCPLHIAAQANQASQVELLVVYGADPGALDLGGKTPVDYARAEGHNTLADRLVEIQYELTDRLAHYVCGKKPEHRDNQHFIIPEMGDTSSDLSEFAKQAKKKLQALPNHLFEELAMDVYDEVDRRENEAFWLATHDNTLLSDRQTVPFLPVNPDLSTTRNQGRQKLARFNAREFATLIIDILNDARRRQTGVTSPVQTPKEPDKFSYLQHPRISKAGSAISDDEPLYDVVASDDDYISIDTNSVRSLPEDMKRDEPADASALRRQTPLSIISFTESLTSERVEAPVTADEYLEVKRALEVSESQRHRLALSKNDLEHKVTLLASQIDSLMRENKALKSLNMQKRAEAQQIIQNGIDPGSEAHHHHHPAPAPGQPPPLPQAPPPTVTTEPLDEQLQLRPLQDMRPQSMFEPRNQLQKRTSKEEQLQTCLSEANIHLGGEKVSQKGLSLPAESIDPDVANANVPDPDYDLPNEPEDLQARGSSRPVSDAFMDCMTDSTTSLKLPKATATACVSMSEEDLSRLPSQEEVVKKTERITKKIQELLQTAQGGNLESYAPCSEKINSAVTDMAALFAKPVKPDTVNAALQLLTTSSLRLQDECRKCAQAADAGEKDRSQMTQLIIQFAYDIAKAAKQLVTLFQ